MSSQDISSHISVVCMGIIPSIVSNQVQLGVKQFADFDPAKMMGQLATLQNATASDISTVGAEAQKAKTGQTMSAIQDQTVKSVMSGLQDSDDGQNKMLDINSLMTAFEDYANRAIDGEAGVAVTYYLNRDVPDISDSPKPN